MPFKSEKQRKWMWANDPEMAKKWEKEEKMKKETKVRQLIKKMVREMMKEDFAGSYPAHVRKQFDGKRRKQSEVLGYKLTGKDDVKTEIGDATIKETAKRDYKDEYKKFQSSTKSKKYRAELNKYNRQKGTYGNGDGKDASHKGGKIVGFEKESVNRGRAEKSRLKKESTKEYGKSLDKIANDKKLKMISKKDRDILKKLADMMKNEGKITEKSAISLNLWIKEFERLAKKNRMKPVDFVKKHISKRKGMDNEVVKNVLKHFQKNEGKLTEAITGSDRKIMMMIVREILENLKKVSKSIKPSNQIGRGVLSILRAMTYTPDNANYKNYKKYFPKTFNSKLTQKRVAQFHKQTDKVQLTMVKQAMNKVLGEGKLSEVSAGVNVWYFYKKANKDKNKFFKMLSDFRKKHSDTKWIKMLNYALDDFNENPKKYKTIDDKQNILFKNLQNNKKVREGKLTEGGAQIAKTILKQLGGNKFIAMTGAKNLAHTNKGLQMKIGRNAKGVTHVIIDLDKGKDLYDIEFVKVRGTKRTTVKKLKGIYADQLGEVFTRYTGLNVRL